MKSRLIKELENRYKKKPLIERIKLQIKINLYLIKVIGFKLFVAGYINKVFKLFNKSKEIMEFANKLMYVFYLFVFSIVCIGMINLFGFHWIYIIIPIVIPIFLSYLEYKYNTNE